MKQHTKTTSIVLAILLQLAPMARQVVTQIAAFAPNIAVIFRWGIGVSALLGGVDAVSGASTIITSPKTASGTVGVPFSYRITTGPEVANTFAASPLPANLTVNTSSGYITGTPAVSGTFSVNLTASDSGKANRTVTAVLALTIASGGPVAPSITGPPTSLTITAGNPAAFNVTATGTAPLSYQWRFNGANISGATASSYTIANAQAANAGAYSVVVNNSAGSVTSASATLTVNPAPVAPSITTQPSSQTVNNGANVSFTLVATGTAPLRYQWRFNNANIAGATSSTYSLSNVQTSNAGNYSVLVSNVAGSVTSATATLTVNVVPVAPTIITLPASLTVSVGSAASFGVTATGTAPLFYQWRFNGADIGGATSSSYALNNVQDANGGGYSVLISNAVGSVLSASATLTVTPAPVAPSITTPPAPQTVATGASATFSVIASGTAPLSYQWRFNGAKITGATGSSYTLNNALAANAGNYSVVVSNVAGGVASADALLTVLPPPPVAPSITTQPVSQTAVLGGSATFSVTATGTAPLFYQWRLNGGDIAGATSASFMIASVQNTEAGNYDVVVSNSVGSLTSAAATLTIVASKPAAGVFQGLFYNTNNVALVSSGYLWLTLDENSGFKAVLDTATEEIDFTGQFSDSGLAVIRQLGSGSLTVTLRLNVTSGSDHLTGRVSGNAWSAAVLADRQASVAAGNYPLVFQGATGSGDDDAARSAENGGKNHSGRGTARISRNGLLRFHGKIAPGLRVRQKSAVSANGEWPFYAVLSRNRGVVLGWIQVSPPPAASATGDLIWLQTDGSETAITVTPP